MARPDAVTARAPQPIRTDRTRQRRVPARKPVPWSRSAPRAIISRRLRIALAEVADPSSVPCVNSPCFSIQPTTIRSSRPYSTPKKRGACELLHKTAGRLGLDLRHGPEDSLATVRSAPHRPRHRLRLDRGRCLGSLDRVDLFHSDLILCRQRGESRSQNAVSRYLVAAKGSVCAVLVRTPANPREVTVKRNASRS